MKWVFFVRELMRPVHVPPGEMRELDDQLYSDLLAIPGGNEAMLNLTPGAVKGALSAFFGYSPFYDRPLSSAKIIPCPECMVYDQSTHQIVCLKQFTRCDTCQGSQSFVAAIFIIPTVYHAELRRRIRAAIQARERPHGR